MLILGIDPGTTAIGYSVINAADRNTPRLLDAGMLRVRAHESGERLREVHRELTALIGTWRPACASVEKLFFAANLKTAIAVSESRGVILLTCILAGLKVYEYSPLEIKKIVTGDGKADKKQMEKMVRLTIPDTAALGARDDVFDAIASALACCYLVSRKKIPNDPP